MKLILLYVLFGKSDQIKWNIIVNLILYVWNSAYQVTLQKVEIIYIMETNRDLEACGNNTEQRELVLKDQIIIKCALHVCMFVIAEIGPTHDKGAMRRERVCKSPGCICSVALLCISECEFELPA